MAKGIMTFEQLPKAVSELTNQATGTAVGTGGYRACMYSRNIAVAEFTKQCTTKCSTLPKPKAFPKFAYMWIKRTPPPKPSIKNWAWQSAIIVCMRRRYKI